MAQHRFAATNVTRAIALEGTLSPRALRTALAALQGRHPRMRARIVDGRSPSFDHSAPAPRLQLVQRSDDQHWRAVLEQLLNRPLDHAAGPLFELHYLYSEQQRRAELILVGDHAACDGVSMNRLSGELLALCAGAAAQPERPAAPALDALVPPSSPGPCLASLGKALGRSARVAIERRLREPRAAGVSSAHAFTVLSRERTAALVAKARLAGTTVTGALMAAALLAVHAVRPGTDRLALSVPVNLRPRLANGALTSEDVGNYTSAAFFAARITAGVWPLARALKTELDACTRGDAMLAAVPWLYRTARLFLRPGRPPLAHAMLSNSGMVPLKHDYGAFRTIGFYSATSAPLVSADFCFFCNTLHSRLCINLVFATELVSRTEAEAVLTRCGDLLIHA